MKNFLNKHKKILTMTVPVITVVLLCVLTGTLVSMREKANELGNQLSYLIDTNSMLQSQMLNLQENIEVALEEEASFVEKYTIEVLDADFAKGNYQVKITVVPKEYSDATKVSIFFGVNEIPLLLNRYAYEGTAQLELKDNYDSNVAFLIANGDKRNTEVLKDYEGLQTRLKDLLYGSVSEIPQYKEGKIYFHDEIAYILNAYEDYTYETLELVLMVDEEERKVVNLMEPQNKKDEEKGNGTYNHEGTISAATQIVYEMSGTTVFKENVKVEEGQSIRLFLRSQCGNGYTLEYDLFSAVIEAEGLNGFEEAMDYFEPNYCVYDKKGNKREME